MAGEYAVTEKFTFMVEIVGETNSDPSDSNEPIEFLVAFAYDLPGGLIFDTGFGAGFNSASPDVRVTSGISYSYKFD